AAYVAVIGPGDGASEAECALAFELGELLASRGAVVLTGGRGGVMAAAARGAAAAGGTSVGLLPGTSRTDGEPAHTVLLATGLGELRNGLLVRCADAVIAVGGSWGTLSEIALAMRTGVPVVQLAGRSIDFADRRPDEAAVAKAATPAEAVATVLEQQSS
ncbi:MAG TPA: TIGR00725 family protein, partial [Jatrophihabitantaceae bacterium]|nr:TIGR00725 family protein [Jatrophihabitantaceae bacterium]